MGGGEWRNNKFLCKEEIEIPKTFGNERYILLFFFQVRIMTSYCKATPFFFYFLYIIFLFYARELNTTEAMIQRIEPYPIYYRHRRCHGECVQKRIFKIIYNIYFFYYGIRSIIFPLKYLFFRSICNPLSVY